MLAGMGVEHEYPVIPGRDYAGVVEQAGAAVSGYRPGDEVFGFLLHANPAVHDGAWAELITAHRGAVDRARARRGRAGRRGRRAAGRHHRDDRDRRA